jgi:hypothetical protein
MSVAMLITRPKLKELSFNPVEDVQHLIDSFIPENRIFREDDVKIISNEITRIFEYYEREATDDITFREASMLQHFIRILNYGVLFKFVVMIKLSNQTIHRIYYE